MAYIAALLDNPSTESHGMVPFIYRDGQNKFQVTGFKKAYGPLDQEELDNYIRGGHFLEVGMDCVGGIGSSELPTVALWVGNEFSTNVQRVLPLYNCYWINNEWWNTCPTGCFALLRSNEAYDVLEDFVEYAASKFTLATDLEEKKTITRLMKWTLPGHELTHQCQKLCGMWEEYHERMWKKR